MATSFTAAAVALLVASGCVGSNDDDDSQVLDTSRNGSVVNDPIPIGKLTLTFEDGPSQYSKNIIDTLTGYGVPATFFWVGARIDGRRELLAYARDRGHQIGNHSYYHDRQVLLSAAEFRHRLRATKANIGDADNGRLYYRFPFGESTPTLFSRLTATRFEGRSYVNVGWDIDSSDFEFNAGYPDVENSSRIRIENDECNGQPNPFRNDFVGWTQFVARKARGGVMLFHDVAQITHDYLGEIITFLRNPTAYWASLDAKTRADYQRYYTCTATDPNIAFTFASIYSGTWPSFVQAGKGPADCNTEYNAADYPPATTSYARDIKPLLTKHSCDSAGCHNADRLSSYSVLSVSDMLGAGAQAQRLGRCDIVRGKPGDSYLVDKLRGTGDGAQMPLQLPAMPQADVDKIVQWITEGAPP